MNITVRKLDPQSIGQFIELLHVFEVEFEMNSFNRPSRDYLQRLLDQPDFWVFVALVGDEVVGGLTAYVLPQYYTEKPLVYLYDLAVSAQFQRRGVGRQLLADLTQQGRLAGVDEVFVQADGDDMIALDFYRGTGGNAEPVVHFTYLV